MRRFILIACLVGASALKSQKPKAEAKDSSEEVMIGDLTTTQRANLPKFFWHKEMAAYDAKGFSWHAYRFSKDSPGLEKHPAKVRNASDAKFEIVCCLEDATIGKFKALPKRTPDEPYLVKYLSGTKSVLQMFEEREDFLAVNYDLRDMMDKQDAPVRGITIAPHNFYNGKRQPVDAPRQFFVTFQGRKTSKLRRELHEAFNNHHMYKLWKNISVETVMDRNWNVKQQTGDYKFNMKMNSSYVLLPLGDDRWSLRFSETIGAGAIPVILADGLTLPYENIIDWRKAAIRLPDYQARSADEIMKRLPSDEETIMKMRREVYEINRKFFANKDVRADAMLMEADAFVKKHSKYSPLWSPAEAEPWLEEGRKGATEESKAIALKLAKTFEMKETDATVADQKATLIKRK